MPQPAKSVHRRDSTCRDPRQMCTRILVRRVPASAAVKAAGVRLAQGQPVRWCAIRDGFAKLRTPSRDRTPAPWRLIRSRRVCGTDGGGSRCEFAFLRTAPETGNGNGRAASRTCRAPRATHAERRAGGKAWASAGSGPGVAAARRPPGRHPRGGGPRRQAAGDRVGRPSRPPYAGFPARGVGLLMASRTARS